MANIGSAVSSAGRFGNGIFGKILKIKFSYWFVVILLIQAISIGIQGDSTFSIVTAIGERFFNMFENLHSTSLQVIDSNAQFTGYLNFLGVLWNLFSNIWLIYLWFKLLMFCIIWLTPLSNESNKFVNLLLTTMAFYLLQIAYLFFMKYEVGSEIFISYGFFDLLKMPYTCFVDFFRAVTLIFSSTSFNKISPQIENFSNLSNICTNPSGCVI